MDGKGGRERGREGERRDAERNIECKGGERERERERERIMEGRVRWQGRSRLKTGKMRPV